MDYTKSLDTFVNKITNRTTSQINKSNFDKTYIGKVIGSIKDDNEKVVRWQIFANASTFNVLAENCNVTEIGQRVRMFIPSNQRDMVYAEVITVSGAHIRGELPDKIVKVSDNEVYAVYGKYKQTWTAKGSGNTRTDFVEKIEEVDGV